jgi:hypothetical protein
VKSSTRRGERGERIFNSSFSFQYSWSEIIHKKRRKGAYLQLFVQFSVFIEIILSIRNI